MRKIENIVVHCTAGSQRATVRDLWAEFNRKRWRNPGYHYLVTADGKVTQLLDDAGIANGAKGHNARSLHVAYTGGVDTTKPSLPPIDNRTEAQRLALRALLLTLRKRYPDAEIIGHRDIPGVNKACPSFDAKTEYKDI